MPPLTLQNPSAPAQPLPRARDGHSGATSRTDTAAELAAENWRANLRALSLSQPAVIEAARHGAPDVEWVFARDGSLTAFDANRRWWAGCSVPLLAAKAMLATLDVTGRAACFLRPTLAAHLRVALDGSRRDQAILCVHPDLADLRVLLGAGDFSREVADGRLWFAWGGDWAGEMTRLFHDRLGLPTPSQFVRLPTTPPEEVDRMVAAAQQVFTRVNADRTNLLSEQSRATRGGPARKARVCVIAPSGFRLWGDAGAVLLDTFERAGEAATRFDPDHPASGSAPALAAAARDCDVLVSADVARADAPGVLPPDLRWVTWVTTLRIPAFAAAGPNDALLVADPAWKSSAERLGWPACRVSVAGWPAATRLAAPPADHHAPLAVIADTFPLDAQPPTRLSEFSSHLLLWNEILGEITRDPFAVGDDAGDYLSARMRRFGVSDGGFDHRLFVERLIVPAYQHAVARALLAANVPLVLRGEGWGRMSEFAPHAGGAVRSRRDLTRATRGVRGLVHVWPTSQAHPIDGLGLPVLRHGGQTFRAFLEQARKPFQDGTRSQVPPLRPELVRSFV